MAIACMLDILSYSVKKSIKTMEKSPAGIPDPCRSLSRDVPSSSIHKVNEEVKATLEREQ